MDRIGKSILAISFMSFGGLAYSATMTATLNVTANVVPGCTALSTTSLDFGSLTLPRASVLDGTATISATCGTGVAYSIDIDAGLNPIGVTPRRRMVTAAFPTDSSNLAYALYKDAGRTQPWGTGADSGTVLNSTGTGAVQVQSVYGQIDNFVNASTVGAYSDTVTVTLTF